MRKIELLYENFINGVSDLQIKVNVKELDEHGNIYTIYTFFEVWANQEKRLRVTNNEYLPLVNSGTKITG